MHLAHFIQRYPPALGGSESYFARLSQDCQMQGHSVTVWTSSSIDLEAFWSPDANALPTDTIVQDNVTVRRYAPSHFFGRRYLLKCLSLFPWRRGQCLSFPCNPISYSMRRDTRRDDFACDLVHASAFPYAFPLVCALELARRRKIPFLLTPFLHLGATDQRDRTHRQYTHPALRWLLRQADLVFVQTPSEANAARELGVPDSRLILQGLGVDAAECTGGDRVAFRERLGIAPDEVIIGHLANQSAEKGTIDLLAAAQIAWQRGARFRLLLAGPQMPNFRRYWESYPCPENVIQLGVIDDVTRRDFYATIDGFALPSRSDSFGLVLLEAWANGVPNLAYSAGGPADLIHHDQDGALVRCGDITGLVQYLERWCADPALRCAWGEQGRQRTLREFRWEDKLAIVRTAYTHITGMTTR